MATIRVKRGPTDAIDSYLGVSGELVLNLDNNHLHVMNGTAAGGTVIANKQDLTDYLSITAANDIISKKINCIGDRGLVAGYETLIDSAANDIVIDANTNDTTVITSTANVTISDGSSGLTYTKTIAIATTDVTIQLGSKQNQVSGISPTIVANSVFVCCWYGTFGLATYITGGVEPTDGTGDTTGTTS